MLDNASIYRKRKSTFLVGCFFVCGCLFTYGRVGVYSLTSSATRIIYKTKIEKIFETTKFLYKFFFNLFS